VLSFDAPRFADGRLIQQPAVGILSVKICAAAEPRSLADQSKFSSFGSSAIVERCAAKLIRLIRSAVEIRRLQHAQLTEDRYFNSNGVPIRIDVGVDLSSSSCTVGAGVAPFITLAFNLATIIVSSRSICGHGKSDRPRIHAYPATDRDIIRLLDHSGSARHPRGIFRRFVAKLVTEHPY
jgi:hypothetical protein